MSQPATPSSSPPDGFVGRARELAGLRAAFDDARGGRGRIVLLAGEPGIGKSRLADEAARDARAAGAEVLVGRCYEDAGAPAFWPWIQVVRAYVRVRDAETLAAELSGGAAEVAALVPELHARLPGLGEPSALDGPHARFRFFTALTGALIAAAARRPLVIVLEDLHGADPSSLLLLQFLAREVRAAALVVVGTLRDSAFAAGHPLAVTMGELVREQVSAPLELRGLAVGEVAALMAQLAGTAPTAALVAAVQARTEGNPLYVIETVRAQLARGGLPATAEYMVVPATVRLAIGQRLAALSAPARATLTLAALFGREFRADIVARAGELSVSTVLEHVEEATAARVVVPAGDGALRHRFAHALIAEVLAAEPGERQRIDLNCRAARVLAAHPRAEDWVAEIAHHWMVAGPGGVAAEAVAWAQRAAERALGVFAYEEAAAWYRRALEALEWSDELQPVLRTELLLGLGEAAKRAGTVEDAKAAFAEAGALGRSLGSAELETRAALGYAPAVNFAEQPAPDPVVVDRLEQAIAAWEGRDAGLHARALGRLSLSLFFGDRARRDAAAAAAIAMARRLGDQAALIDVLAMTLTLSAPGLAVDDRLAQASELVRIAGTLRNSEALAIGRLWSCVALLEHGDVAGADIEQRALERLAEDQRQPAWHWYVRHLRAVREVLGGDFAACERAIQEAFEIGRGSLPFAAPAYFVAQMLALRIFQGRPDEEVARYASTFAGHPDPTAVTPLAWAANELGRLGEAQAVLDRVMANDNAAIGDSSVHPRLLATMLAEICAALPDATAAARLYPILAPHARSWVMWAEGMILGPVTHPLGLLARTMGNLDEAAAHFEHAIAETRRLGARPFLARALHEHGVLLRMRDRPGDAARAATLLAEARAIAEAIGMDGLRRKLAALGAVSAPLDPARAVFRREADYWVVTYRGETIRLRDTRGLRYLAALLQHPGREFAAAELAGGHGAGAAVSASDEGIRVRRSLDEGAGVVLDGPAQLAYRRRLRELEDELAEADRRADPAGAAQARTEAKALRAELARTERGDRTGTSGERARLTVTKGIGTALARIAAEHPALGAHLRATVRRGYFCVYVPDPREPIRWESS